MTSETSSRLAPDNAELLDRYLNVRLQTLRLCEPLEIEDYNLQSMPEASPVKWHLAHTTWFFETFVLEPTIAGYRPFHPRYRQIFNSYYAAVGERFERGRRGLLSRPSVETVIAYRQAVDDGVANLLESGALSDEILERIVLGLHHEQQHQELILTDLKHAFSVNPLRSAYSTKGGHGPGKTSSAPRLEWMEVQGGVRRIGFAGTGFCFDNESPAHRVFIEPFAMASRLVTNGEYLEFIEDDAYLREDLWLAAGWDMVRLHAWNAPLYWEMVDGSWQVFTLAGLKSLERSEPVCHVSYFEADAYARWKGCVLPSEFEWEAVAQSLPIEGNFVESARLRPVAALDRQMFGDAWEWTRSAYTAYPAYRAMDGALGEYNGKFMSGQQVLRGGSCVTPRDHIRASYRNFFPPEARWQFAGIRLVRFPEGNER